MKFKKEFLRISATAFALSLFQVILRSLQMYFMISASSYDRAYNFILINYIFSFVNSVIISLLIFAAFYFFSKRSDSPLELRPTVLALLFGNIPSLVVGAIIYSGLVIGANVEVILELLAQFFMAYLVENCLVALAGLFVGYVRRTKSALGAEEK